MRITGGSLRGRIVERPPGVVRPAMDRMRESLFATLGDISGLSFLDLFSGSGVIGLEAYSRGARPLHCVEKDRGKLHVIRQNLAMAEEGEAKVSIMPVERFIMAWKSSFNLIFLDPPFDYPFKAQLLERIGSSQLIGAFTRVLIHFPQEDSLPDSIVPAGSSGPEGRGVQAQHGLQAYDKRVYGRSIVHFYQADSGLGAAELGNSENI